MPKTENGNGLSFIFPEEIPHSALLESGYSSNGAVATDCTIALGFKPTAATTTPLNDMTGHYLLTIQKQGATVKVWKQGVQLADYTGSVGNTYAEFVSNVLTHYSGSNKGYYSRLAIVEEVKTYTDFWEPSDMVTGLWVPKSLDGLTLHTHLDFGDAGAADEVSVSGGWSSSAMAKAGVSSNYGIFGQVQRIPNGTRVTALKIYSVSGNTGACKLGIYKKTGAASGTVVVVKTVTLIASGWVTGVLDEPYTIPDDGGTYYMCAYSSGQLSGTAFGNGWDWPGLNFVTGGSYTGTANQRSPVTAWSGTVAAGLGKDVSGNGNHWDLTGEQTLDVPTNNHATLNPLFPMSTLDYSDGNLLVSGYSFTSGTLQAESKTYYEAEMLAVSAAVGFGFGTRDAKGTNPGKSVDAFVYFNTGEVYRNGILDATVASYTTSDTVAATYDPDTDAVSFRKNDIQVYTQTGFGESLLPVFASNNAGDSIKFNFGATGFKYTPPTGFKALCIQNRPDRTIMKSATVVDVILTNGTGEAVDILAPHFSGGVDFAMIKSLDDLYSWYVFDSERGPLDALHTNEVNANYTYADSLTSFNQDGISLGAYTEVNKADSRFLNVLLKAGAEHGFEMKLQRNFTSGVALNHGLGQPITFALYKSLAARNWLVWHKDLPDGTFLKLDTTDAAQATNIMSTNTATQFTPDNISGWDGDDVMFYLFTDSDVFKAFSYKGNAYANGPFINLEGKVLSIPFLKNTAATTAWINTDTVCNSSNGTSDIYVQPNATDMEARADMVTMASVGFKVPNQYSSMNTNGQLYVGLAIMESTISNAF